MSDINITVNDEIVNIDVIDTPVVVEVTNSPGPAGAGVAAGGTTGQVLAKASNTNYDTVWVNPSTGGVPYSGATGNVNIGEFELKAGQLTLDTSPTGTAAVGTTRWNDTIGSSETTLKGGNVILKNGVDLVARVVNKVTPNATLTKAAYQAVRVSGAQGQRLAVAYAQANNDANSADTIGIVIETIATNQEGFIMTVGQLEGINTTGSLQGESWADGDVLYLSPTTPGALTNIKPTAVTGHIVVVGYVEYAHANNGKIYIKIMNGWELDELHNVSIVSPANNQGLFYNSTNTLWENKTISTALGYTPVPTTRNITINGVTYDLSTDRTWTISTGISGSGASGQVTYWTGSSAVSGSNNLFWDNANGRLGIGTNAPAYDFDLVKTSATAVIGRIRNLSADGYSTLTISNDLGQVANYSIFGSNYVTASLRNKVFLTSEATNGFGFSLYNNSATAHFSIFTTTSLTERFRLFGNTGNLVLQNGGTFTDNGQRLQVYGDTLLRGSGATSATTALTVQNSSSTNLFRVFNDGTAQLNLNATSVSGLSVINAANTGIAGGRVLVQANNTTLSFFNHYNSTATFGLANNGGFGSSDSIILFTDANILNGGTNSIQFRTGGYDTTQERMRIKPNGQVRFVPLASAPASPQAGDVYYDSTLNKLRVYTTAWETITSI